jgi:hypothetical protein
MVVPVFGVDEGSRFHPPIDLKGLDGAFQICAALR